MSVCCCAMEGVCLRWRRMKTWPDDRSETQKGRKRIYVWHWEGEKSSIPRHANRNPCQQPNQTKSAIQTNKQTPFTPARNNNKSAPFPFLPGEIACGNLKLIAQCHLLLTMTIQAHRAHNRLEIFSIVGNIFCWRKLGRRGRRGVFGRKERRRGVKITVAMTMGVLPPLLLGLARDLLVFGGPLLAHVHVVVQWRRGGSVRVHVLMAGGGCGGKGGRETSGGWGRKRVERAHPWLRSIGGRKVVWWRGLFGGRVVVVWHGRGGFEDAIATAAIVAVSMWIVVGIGWGRGRTKTWEAGGTAGGHSTIGQKVGWHSPVHFFVARVRRGDGAMVVVLSIRGRCCLGVVVDFGTVVAEALGALLLRTVWAGGFAKWVGVCLQEQGFIDNAVQFMGDTSDAVGGACAPQLLATAVGAGSASLEAFLADSLSEIHLCLWLSLVGEWRYDWVRIEDGCRKCKTRKCGDSERVWERVNEWECKMLVVNWISVQVQGYIVRSRKDKGDLSWDDYDSKIEGERRRGLEIDCRFCLFEEKKKKEKREEEEGKRKNIKKKKREWQ